MAEIEDWLIYDYDKLIMVYLYNKILGSYEK